MTKIAELREYAKEHKWSEDRHDFEKKISCFSASISIERYDEGWVVTGDMRMEYPREKGYADLKNVGHDFQPIVPTRAEAFGRMLDAMKFFDAMYQLFEWVDVDVSVYPAWIAPENVKEETK